MLETRQPVSGRVLFGTVLVALGALWTLDNLGLIQSEPILRFWPVLVIAVGVAKLTGYGARPHRAMGVLFLIAGGFLLANSLGVADFSISDIWPVALIVFGGSLLMRVPAQPTASGADQAEVIKLFAMWSASKRRVLSHKFRGGEATAVMGGLEIDLREARAENGRAELDLLVWWGSIEIFVSDTWTVVNEGVVIMGGLEDKTKEVPAAGAERNVLVLRGMTVMGGIEVKN